MIVGIVSAMIRWEPNLKKQLLWAANHGFASIELSCRSWQHQIEGLWHKRWDPVDVIVREYRSFLTPFKNINLHASFFFTYDEVYVSPHPLCQAIYLDEVRWACEIAAQIGARVVTCHSGWLVHGKTEEQRERSFLEGVQQLNEVAVKYNVFIALETVEYLLPLEYCGLLTRINAPNVGLTLDIGHAHRTCPVGMPVHLFSKPAYAAFGTIENFIWTFRDKIVHVHVHDCNGMESHLSLGTGNVDFAAILRTLKAIDYSGVLSLEFEGDETVQLLGKKYLEDILEQLRNSEKQT